VTSGIFLQGIQEILIAADHQKLPSFADIAGAPRLLFNASECGIGRAGRRRGAVAFGAGGRLERGCRRIQGRGLR
jgi:hypothetical protein